MPVTLEDIAKRVGKSITTVSRALHGYDDVSPETKELVRSVAEEMGYTPSTLAQRLQKKRSDTLGLILPTFGPRFSDPFFSEFLAGVGNQASEQGYDMLVSTRAPGEEEMNAYRLNVQSRRVDGFIVVRTRRQDTRIDYLSSIEFPFVAFGRTEGVIDYPFVDENSLLGMRMIAEHLMGFGHQRIACISAPPYLMFSEYRIRGLREGLSKDKLYLPDDMVFEGDLTLRGGYEQARGILNLSDYPTAIAACNDLMALGAVSAAQEQGLVIGKDISITGFDDIPMAEHAHPPLTTVRQPIYQIGRKVCEMLIDLIQGRSLEERQIILEPELVVRGSSGAAPQN